MTLMILQGIYPILIHIFSAMAHFSVKKFWDGSKFNEKLNLKYWTSNLELFQNFWLKKWANSGKKHAIKILSHFKGSYFKIKCIYLISLKWMIAHSFFRAISSKSVWKPILVNITWLQWFTVNVIFLPKSISSLIRSITPKPLW